ncbi:MAG TPA: hypothetical protein VGR29_10470 [Thermomicrobiales bacterium]|nr:hypothetical protein [Thermomicrobiales bacterium]
MCVNQYQHEHQVKIVISTYHHDAIQAENVRLAHTDQRRRTRAVETLRTAVRSLFTPAGDHMSQQLVSRPALVNTPSDKVLIA